MIWQFLMALEQPTDYAFTIDPEGVIHIKPIASLENARVKDLARFL